MHGPEEWSSPERVQNPAYRPTGIFTAAALGFAAGLAVIVLASIAAADAITYRPPGVDVVVRLPVPAGPVEMDKGQ